MNNSDKNALSCQLLFEFMRKKLRYIAFALFRTPGLQARTGHDAAAKGERAGQHHGHMGRPVGIDVEEQGHQRRAQRLAREPRRGLHAAGPSAAVGRGRTEQQVVVGRLEKAEAETAQHQPRHQAAIAHRGVDIGQQEATHAHHQQSHAAQKPRMDAADQRAGQRSGHHDDQGPGHHEQPRLGGIHAESEVEHEGQGHHGQHLGGEREHAREHGQGEDGDAQQVERQNGIGLAELATDEHEAHHGQQDSPAGYPTAGDFVGEGFEAAEKEAEGQCVEHGGGDVETAAFHPCGVGRQELVAQKEGQQAQGDVHGKQPRPRGHGKDEARQGRTGHRGQGYDRGVQAQATGQVAAGIDEAHQRTIHAHHHGRAHALQHAREHQDGKRAGKGATKGADGEKHHPRQVEPTETEQLAGRGGRQKRHDDDQLEGVDNPNGIGGGDLQPGGNGGQGHVANRTVDDGQEKAGEDGGHGIVDAGAVQTVPLQVSRHAGNIRAFSCRFHTYKLPQRKFVR